MKREWFVSLTVAEMNKSRVSPDGTVKAVCANPADVHKELVVIVQSRFTHFVNGFYTIKTENTEGGVHEW